MVSIYAYTSLIGIGGFFLGYDVGVISGVLAMGPFKALFVHGDWLKGFIVTVFILGCMAGAALASLTAARCGRRDSIMVACGLFAVGGLGQAACSTIGFLLPLRFTSGVAVGITSALVPLYNSELAPAHMRGRLITWNQIAMTGGIMVAFWANYLLEPYHMGWRIALGLQVVPAVVLLAGLTCVPRSPRWLVSKGRSEEALAALLALRNGNEEVAQQELRAIEAAALADAREAADGWDVFLRAGAARRRLAVGFILQFGQQLTGINAIMLYAPAIFASLGEPSASASLLADGINGVVNFASTFIAFVLLDRYGRRFLLMMGAASMGAAMVVLATLGYIFSTTTATGDVRMTSTAAGLTCIGCVYFFVFSFAYSWGPVVWATCTELFPNSQRAKGVSATTFANWAMGAAVGQFMPPLFSDLHWGVFFGFGACCLALFAWVWSSLPETRGLSIDELHGLFAQGRGGKEQDPGRQAIVEHEAQSPASAGRLGS